MSGYNKVIELLAEELAACLDRNAALCRELERLMLLVDADNAEYIRQLLRK